MASNDLRHALRRQHNAGIIVQVCLAAVTGSGLAQWWQTGLVPWLNLSVIVLGIGVLLWGKGLRRGVLRRMRRK